MWYSKTRTFILQITWGKPNPLWIRWWRSVGHHTMPGFTLSMLKHVVTYVILHDVINQVTRSNTSGRLVKHNLLHNRGRRREGRRSIGYLMLVCVCVCVWVCVVCMCVGYVRVCYVVCVWEECVYMCYVLCCVYMCYVSCCVCVCERIEWM